MRWQSFSVRNQKTNNRDNRSEERQVKMAEIPKTPLKQQIALGSPTFDKIMVERGGAQIVYPTQPFKHGYKVYWLDSKPPDFSRRLSLSDNEISLIKKFMDGKWELQRFEREDLQRLKARLVQRCNVQNPNDLTWDDILAHIREQVQADLANIKLTESVGNATPAKEWWITTLFKSIIEKGWQIFTKSFWEAVLDRVWPKQ